MVVGKSTHGKVGSGRERVARAKLNYEERAMAAGYAKTFMPPSSVKEKEFMSRPMGCKGVGFSFVRCKPGHGATYVHRHKIQEEVFIALKGDGTIILDGKRIRMPEGTIVRVSPRVCGRSATILKKTLCIWC